MRFGSKIITIERGMTVNQIAWKNGYNFNIITYINKMRDLIQHKRFGGNWKLHGEKCEFH
uniref:Uncharacterized protein n=1 Tax=Erwinia amylovora ATCC BAA-2158 TaxID=889211 RepID=E5B5M6_ERWAM|nr:hypothetical protein predicted by Glimmer/Critica [Erwinia amylovora ATCC BAA-2158]